MRVIVVGAGGHGEVLANIVQEQAQLCGDMRVVGFVDDDPRLCGRQILGLPVLGKLDCLSGITHDAIVVAVGANCQRQLLCSVLVARGEHLIAAVHPSALIASDVVIEPGAMICAGAIVGTGSRIGTAAIVNTAATVDHHTHVGAFAHLAPGVHMGGEVRIDEGALVGIGAVVLPRVRIGKKAVVGAGAVVTTDVSDGATVIGVPARVVVKIPV
jgi:sugar O-acyltransferase (sialic acid O-acetyltransferase NeuD family)